MDESRIRQPGDESLTLLYEGLRRATSTFSAGINFKRPLGSGGTKAHAGLTAANARIVAKLLCFALVVASVPTSVGCNATSLEADAAAASKRALKVQFDAGLSLAGQGSVYRIAVPAELIASAADAKQIRTSCDCVEARVFDFLDATKNRRCGLELTIKPASAADPMSLLLSTEITRGDGLLVTVETQLQEVIILE